jgi:hypothetical protein
MNDTIRDAFFLVLGAWNTHMSDYEQYRAYKLEKKARAAALRAPPVNEVVSEAAPVASVAAAPKAAEKPPGVAWVFMRNFHEAVRMSLREQAEAVASGETMHARQLFADMRRAIVQHALLEDDAAYDVLLKVGQFDVPAFTKQHEEDERLAQLVVSSDSDSFAQHFKDYKVWDCVAFLALG